jgi:protein AaeX
VIEEYTIHGVLLAAAPFTAGVALVIALLVHRVLRALRFYRWVWHPLLFDTALFVLVWALITFHPLPIPQGLLS